MMKKKSSIHKVALSEYRSLNVNANIRVRLTDLGYQRLAEIHNELAFRVPYMRMKNLKYYEKQADKHGYTTFQMWEFMKAFGDVSGLCMPQYYHLDILISEKDLSNHKQPRKK